MSEKNPMVFGLCSLIDLYRMALLDILAYEFTGMHDVGH